MMLYKNFTPFPALSTERLVLRQLEMNDKQQIFSLRSDIEINKYLNRDLSKTVDDAEAFIRTVNENIDKNKSLYWAITSKENNVLMGTICLFGFDDEERKCEIGYELLTDYQGQGIMKEAAAKVISYAFNTIKVKRIEGFFHKDNQRSAKLLEKLSFKNTNRIDKAEPELISYYLTNKMVEVK